MSSSKTLAPPDDALLTALAVEQIATQKRDQTTTAQDVKRDVATRRETSKPNDENDSDVNSRQTSTSARRDKRDSVSRWKTAALAWFGSFAIFCAVATLTFALTRDASPTQTAAKPPLTVLTFVSDAKLAATASAGKNAFATSLAAPLAPRLDAALFFTNKSGLRPPKFSQLIARSPVLPRGCDDYCNYSHYSDYPASRAPTARPAPANASKTRRRLYIRNEKNF